MVIRVPERESGEPYAQVTSAVRDLTDLYGLRVVVDSSPNSLPPTLIATKREMVIAVEPMSKELIESIPEFKDLIDFLKSHNLDESVWKVLGDQNILIFFSSRIYKQKFYIGRGASQSFNTNYILLGVYIVINLTFTFYYNFDF